MGTIGDGEDCGRRGRDGKGDGVCGPVPAGDLETGGAGDAVGNDGADLVGRDKEQRGGDAIEGDARAAERGAGGEDGRGRAEIAPWNRILTAEKPGCPTQPNAFLVEITQGRNALWLASAG